MHDDRGIAADGRKIPGQGSGSARGRLAALLDPRGQALPLALLAILIVLGTALRLDALTGRFGLVSGPAWLRSLQSGSQAVVGALRAPIAGWEREPLYPHQYDPPSHYRSDPFTYLKRAREMKSFYEAHYREPVFPFVVRGWLWLLADQDVAVSFASATFSVLCIVAAYLLGTLAFSRWVGCAAALGLAIEREVIFWGVAGWRDDTFAFAVAIATCCMLWCRRKPTIDKAIALGLAAAFAVLTRFFSVAFLAPGFLFLLLRSAGSSRDRRRGVLIATAMLVVLVLPYLVNCWRVYGDPFYTLNYQPLYYLAAEGAQPSSNTGALGYIGGKFLEAPFQTLDDAAYGMTAYPFLNKWDGFEPWRAGMGRWLAAAALAGMILFAASTNGRLLLIVLASAQVPFAFTWRLSSDWRYTEFAYPFFLVAAGLAILRGLSLAVPSTRERRGPIRITRRVLAVLALTLGGVAVVAWAMLRLFPVMVFREALLANKQGVIVAGPRDSPFFKEGWSDKITTHNVTARIARGEPAVVEVPLPAIADYDITVRLDPFPPPRNGSTDLPSVHILFNRVLLRTVALTWNPEKVGSYHLVVNRALVRRERNRLTFVGVWSPGALLTADGRGPDRGFRLWYVLVAPSSASQQETPR